MPAAQVDVDAADAAAPTRERALRTPVVGTARACPHCQRLAVPHANLEELDACHVPFVGEQGIVEAGEVLSL
eukprot:1761592-Prymnesium_polylepis.1